MAICVMRRAGRLGNQLFEYAALRTWLGSESQLILLGFDELHGSCTGVEARLIPYSRWRSRAYTAALVAARTIPPRLAQTIDEPFIRTYQPQGLLIGEEAYFQASDLIREGSLEGLRIREEYERAATQHLQQYLRPGEVPVFAHVRRTDYLTWGPDGHPAVVSDSWIQASTRELLEPIPRGRLVVLSDEYDYALRLLAQFQPVPGHGDPSVDLAIMSSCHAGVLSPSSFAWWGAWFAIHRRGAEGPFIAPIHWAGHAVGRWYPPRIETDFLSYVEA